MIIFISKFFWLQEMTTHCNRWLRRFVRKVFAEHKVVRSQYGKDSAARRLHVLGTRCETLCDLIEKKSKERKDLRGGGSTCVFGTT